MLLVTEALARGWLKINSVVCGAEKEVAPARNHMMQETGSDIDKRFSCVTSASVVNDGLVRRVCPVNVFLISSIIRSVWGCPLLNQTFVRVSGNTWEKPSVVN